jgi:hypothetical protein
MEAGSRQLKIYYVSFHERICEQHGVTSWIHWLALMLGSNAIMIRRSTLSTFEAQIRQ